MSAQEPRQPNPEQNHRAPRPASSHPLIAARVVWLEAHWPDLPQAPAMPTRLVRTVDAFGDRPENRDRRGLTVTSRKTVVRTLRHIESAVRKSDGQGDLAHVARRFLKSLAHISEFDETIERARRFRGEVQKTGCRRARTTPVCEEQVYICGEMSGVGEIRLRRERSVAELQKVGRALHLCVAHTNEIGRTYHNALKTRESEFWSLCTAAGPFALLSVRVEEGERCIEEFESGNEKRPEVTDANGRRHALPGALLRNVLRKLNADSSNIDHFTCVGAFPSLLSQRNRETYRDVFADGRNFRIWRFANEIIVAASESRPRKAVPEGCVQWSRFVRCERPRRHRRRGRQPQIRRLPEWEQGACHNAAMDIGELLELLMQSPDLYKAFVGKEGVDANKRSRHFSNCPEPLHFQRASVELLRRSG